MKHYLYNYFKLLSSASIVLDAKTTNRGHSWAIEIVKFFIVCAVSEALAGWVLAFLNSHHVPCFLSLDQPQILFRIGLQSVGAIVFCEIYENMKLKNIGIVKKGFWRSMALGYLLGAALIGFIILILLCMRSIGLSSNLQNVNPLSVLVLFLVYFFQAFGEEVMYRGYLLISLSRKNSVMVSIMISSLLFSLHHYQSSGYGIIGFINLFLLGTLLSILVLQKNNIWIATGVHSAWNFVQGNVFGINVSGSEQASSCTFLTGHNNWGSILYGGSMGLEASIVATIVLIVAIVLVALKNGQKIKPMSKHEETASNIALSIHEKSNMAASQNHKL